MSCWQTEYPIWTYVWRIPFGNPYVFRKYKVSFYRRRIRTLLQNREEALAAHELARNHMIKRRKSTFVPFKKGDKVWLDSQNLKTVYHKKIKPKQEGPFPITEVLGLVTYSNMANPQCFPCSTATTKQGEWSLWRELYWITSRIGRRGGGLWSGNHPQSQKERMRIPVFH